MLGSPYHTIGLLKLSKNMYLKKYEIKYSLRGITNLLHRLGLSFTRPTYTLKNADQEKQEQFKKDFEKLKKTD